MKIDAEQECMRRGESGQALSLAMETLIKYGEAFKAQRLVKIKSAHVAGSFGIFSIRGLYEILARIKADNLKVKVPTTINPRPGESLHLLNKIIFGKQNYLEECFKGMGVTNNYSCVCYEGLNRPAFGDVLAWAESSAVQYANSVIGARTNRNSVLIDICSAITGYVPEFGYLLDEHRRGKILVKLDITEMDASALGFIIGRRVVDKVPVIEHYPFSTSELKNMGGAMAASGAVALFHVIGVTPEAPDVQSIFDGKPENEITITQADLDALRTCKPERATSVVFGCPQMTYEEAMELAVYFDKRKVSIPTSFFMIPEAKSRFEKTDMGVAVMKSGVKLRDFCPVAGFSLRFGNKHILTPSGKCFYYLSGTDYGTVYECLRACGVV